MPFCRQVLHDLHRGICEGISVWEFLASLWNERDKKTRSEYSDP